jgi:SAM-dependent methyltransferase
VAEAPEREAGRLEEVYRRRDAPRAGPPSRLVSPGDLLILQERERLTAELLRESHPTGLAGLDILDFGCGSGWDLLELLALGAAAERLVGVDLLASRLARARRMLPAAALCRANGNALPHRDAAFDLIVQHTVFSSILDDAHRRLVAAELGRVLRPGGSLLWYDLRVDNPRNADVRRVSRAELRALFPGWQLTIRSATLAPPIARRLARLSWLAAAIAGRLPFLRTHWHARLTKPA